MTAILAHLASPNLAPPLPDAAAETLAAELGQLSDMTVYPRSIAATRRGLLFLARRGTEKFAGALAQDPADAAGLSGQTAAVATEGQSLALTIGPANAENAAALRARLPFLNPRPLGLRKSAGCGDRLGLATPGHIRAIRRHAMAPILAQQSIRENARTGRSPQAVLDDATWGVFQEGWRDGFGADADHLKTAADIDSCAAAGYTFFTVDPGEHVDHSAHRAPASQIAAKVEALPWDALASAPADLLARLAGRPVDLGRFSLTLSREDLLRAAAKYGRAVAHTAAMYRHLANVMGQRPFELEMSVDETETVTSLAEHVYIAAELKRLGVIWVSLAPRYAGEFEKGVDYIGDLAAFETSFAEHAAVSQAFGPYKLSLHSGSDKFSIYPTAAKVAGELVHLKTAGTSYLEALRAVALLNPALFREIAVFALARYPADRASYHVSAEPDKAPDPLVLPNDRLAGLLDDFHGREILHVTFGSILNHPDFREPFFATLRGHEETYYRVLETHFNKHFAPFDNVTTENY